MGSFHRVRCVGCLKGGSKSVQEVFNGIKAVHNSETANPVYWVFFHWPPFLEGLPYLVLMTKCDVFLPWLLESRDGCSRYAVLRILRSLCGPLVLPEAPEAKECRCPHPGGLLGISPNSGRLC